MPQVITQADVESAAPGSTLTVAADATITPLAAERATVRNVTIARGGSGSAGGPAVRDAVRTVTRAVIERMGDSSPRVIEAVVQEVLASVGGGASFTSPRGSTLPVLSTGGPSFDVCASCVEQEQSRARRRAVMTTTGKNGKGIVARVTARIADLGGDILDISQTLIGDFFTMIIVVDVSSLSADFARFQAELQETAASVGCQAMIMHEDVMTSLHRV